MKRVHMSVTSRSYWFRAILTIKMGARIRRCNFRSRNIYKMLASIEGVHYFALCFCQKIKKYVHSPVGNHNDKEEEAKIYMQTILVFLVLKIYSGTFICTSTSTSTSPVCIHLTCFFNVSVLMNWIEIAYNGGTHKWSTVQWNYRKVI